MGCIKFCVYMLFIPSVISLGTADIIIKNAYTIRDDMSIGENMYKWDALNMKSASFDLIIDVAYPASIQVNNIREPKNMCKYNWKAKLSLSRAREPIFDGLFFKSSAQSLTFKKVSTQDTSENIFTDGIEGYKVDVNVHDPSSWIFTVIETCKDQVSEASRVVHFMAIRREIRSLLPQDRDRFLDTFQSLWRIPTTIGRQEYGKFYLDIHDLNNLHRQNAGNRNSDHFHEGLGFLSQHLKVTRRMEESLQSIDTWLAAPYWDPTIDMELIKKLKHPLDTILWSSDFFGSPCQFKQESFQFSDDEKWKKAAIIGGRWALSQVPRVGDGSVWGEAAKEMIEQGISVPRNAFGYLRSPWNLNPSPYVTRFMTKETFPEWAKCENIANGIKNSLKGESFKSILENYAQFWSYRIQFPPQAHAGLHDYIGGSFIRMRLTVLKAAVDLNFPLILDKKPWKAFKHQWAILTQKGLWRSWLIEYPEYCKDGTSLDKCRPVCSNKFPRSVVGKFIMISLLHMEAPALPLFDGWYSDHFNIRQYMSGTKLAFLTDVELTRRLANVGDVMCDNLGVTIKGENFESSGVLDPTFWLIHPTTDRLFQMASFALNAKLKTMGRGSVTVDELANAIWPENGTYCGSLASCLTCYQIDTWLSKQIGGNQPSCLNPDEKLPANTSGGFSIEADFFTDQCCIGHGKHDQMYTSFSTNSSQAIMEGPTNKDILYLLQSNLGPQWERGGTVVFDNFRYDHCKHLPRAKSKHNQIYSALKIPQGGTFSSASSYFT